MVMAANDPYQKVSENNGVFDSSLIGAAIGAGGAGAGVFGSRMHYGGIQRRADRDLKRIDIGLNNLSRREGQAVDKYNDKMSSIIDREKTIGGRSGSRGAHRFNERKVEKPLDRLEKHHQKSMSSIHGEFDSMSKSLGKVSDPNYVQTRQDSHMYSKMGGKWAKAGIIGASAVVGGGLGMITDGLTN